MSPATEKSTPGEVVPIPTFPDVCCTTNWFVPTANPPVEMVEVAEVEVAVK